MNNNTENLSGRNSLAENANISKDCLAVIDNYCFTSGCKKIKGFEGQVSCFA
jgi:hypothetical protein